MKEKMQDVVAPPFVPHRLLVLMEHSLDFVELIGAAGVIEGVSAAIKPLGGYDPKDLIGCQYQQFIHPDDRVRAAQVFARVINGDRAETITLRYHRKDGAWRTIRASIRNCLKNPAVHAVLVLTRDVTDQFNAEASLTQARRKLRQLSEQIVVAKEEERTYLAAELHDDVQQILVGLRMHMEASRRTATTDFPPLVNTWIELVQEAIDHLHGLTVALRAPAVDGQGLPMTLRLYIDRLLLSEGQKIVFESDANVGPIAPNVALACLRIVQEGLANAVKHSHAKNLRISLKRVDHNVTVSVRDDGVGFDVKLELARAINHGSVGLLSMRERAALAGGILEIESSVGQGSRVSATFQTERIVGANNDEFRSQRPL